MRFLQQICALCQPRMRCEQPNSHLGPLKIKPSCCSVHHQTNNNNRRCYVTRTVTTTWSGTPCPEHSPTGPTYHHSPFNTWHNDARHPVRNISPSVIGVKGLAVVASCEMHANTVSAPNFALTEESAPRCPSQRLLPHRSPLCLRRQVTSGHG